jgi:SAM-dependent methyltransferase
MYSEIIVRPPTDGGEVVIQYSDMTSLLAFEDNSVDLVWSGQSIEHVPEDAAFRMVSEAFRVLRPGGIFALDTPNGLITSLHSATADLSVVHPEHFKEYTPAELTTILIAAGFSIEQSFGTNHMPETKRTGAFHYRDFVYGAPSSPDIEACYSQFHITRKPL